MRAVPGGAKLPNGGFSKKRTFQPTLNGAICNRETKCINLLKWLTVAERVGFVWLYSHDRMQL